MKREDWHPADIVAGMRKKGTSLAAVSRKAGLASSTLANALTRHWPKGERLIATELGISPEQIWPSRYSKMDAKTWSKLSCRYREVINDDTAV